MNLVDRRGKGSSVWLSAAFAGVCILGADQVEAAKQPKVEICHLDAGEGVFKKISVSGNAVQNHLANHGDIFPGESNDDGSVTLDADCLKVMAPMPILARAYIDKNRNGVYDSSEDLEIAKLLDTNAPVGPSVGDTIALGQYPTTYDPCPAPPSADPCTDIGFFGPLQLPLEVASMGAVSSMIVEVSSAGARYSWEHLASGFSRFRITNLQQSTAFADILDGTAAENMLDLAFVSSGGEPNAGVPVSNPSSDSPEDDYFINVEFPQVP